MTYKYYKLYLISNIIDIFCILLNYILSFDFRLRNSELPVNVSNKFNCMLGKKSRMIRVEVNPQTPTASFRKDDNDGIVFIIPSNIAVHPFIKA